MGVQATFSCTLGSDEAGEHISAGIDTRSEDKGGMNAQDPGKTNGFDPGDQIAFLIFHSENVTIKDIKDIRTTLEDGGERVYHLTTAPLLK